STDADEAFLNRRGEQLVGQRATLTEPIINGRGRIRINDTMWRVKGPDLPAGTEVRVIAFDPLSLEIEVAE
ncbi:MAG TPA: NfeD family protein, partial [Ochrobactrum intermedium]